MRAFALYGLKRLGQFVLVVFVGINIAYLITHATSIDPVSNRSPPHRLRQHQPRGDRDDARVVARVVGLPGTPLEQYLSLAPHRDGGLRAVVVGLPDAGDDADARALPWTIGLS